MLARPSNEEELQKREAIGVIRASRFVREYARSRNAINMETVRTIHHEIFKDAWPEIAGAYRNENLEISDSKHLPPHFSQIVQCMRDSDKEFEKRLKALKSAEAFWLQSQDPTDEQLAIISEIVKIAAWIHHKVTHTHPFREGNGRTGRLAANLILERYGLVGISIRIEKENKNRYRKALAQIDQYEDYSQLEEMIAEGLLERYQGVSMKYLK